MVRGMLSLILIHHFLPAQRRRHRLRSCDVMSVVSPRWHQGIEAPISQLLSSSDHCNQARPPSGSVGDLLQNRKIAQLFLASMSFGRKEFFCINKIYGVILQSVLQWCAKFLGRGHLSPLSHADYTGLVVTLIVNTRHFCFRELRAEISWAMRGAASLHFGSHIILSQEA